MLALAVVAPLISPVEQRGEVLIVTVLFGLAGTLMLYTAVDSGSRIASDSPPPRTAHRVRTSETARVFMKTRQARYEKARALAGLIFGLLFAVAGAVAPFALSEGEANPDARFLMVIGFSPVVISGALMVMVFGRMRQSTTAGQHKVVQSAATTAAETKGESIGATMAMVGLFSGVLLSACAVVLPFIVTGPSRAGIATPTAIMGGVGMALSLTSVWVIRRRNRTNTHSAAAVVSTQPKPRRAPVPRIPSGILYRIMVPAAILMLFVLIVVVILTVIAATVTPLVH